MNIKKVPQVCWRDYSNDYQQEPKEHVVFVQELHQQERLLLVDTKLYLDNYPNFLHFCSNYNNLRILNIQFFLCNLHWPPVQVHHSLHHHTSTQTNTLN